MSLKNLLTGLGITAALLPLILIAQTTTSTPSSTATENNPIVLQVSPTGRVLMRGTLASVAGGTLTVNSWGGVWTVNVPSSAEVLPVAAGNDITQFKTGDFVGIQGTVSQSASWTIDAALIRDWTYRQEVNQERRQNIQSVREAIQSETPRNYQGTASGVSASTFTLTTGNGATYTVEVASNAKVLNRNWLAFSLANIQNGDTVRIWGPRASSTITASIVRDISIPR